MKRLSNLLMFLSMCACGVSGEPGIKNSDVITSRPTQDITSSHQNLTAEQQSNVSTTSKPVVTDINWQELKEIRYSSSGFNPKHTPETLILEKELMTWISRYPFERLCIAFNDYDNALNAYDGEMIGVIGPDYIPLPLAPVGEWTHMTEEEVEAASRRDCQAMPYVKLIPNNHRILYEGKEYVSGGCSNRISRNGLIFQYYPEGNRSFLAYREKDGRMHVLRGPRGFAHGLVLKERIEKRLKHIDSICDEPLK